MCNINIVCETLILPKNKVMIVCRGVLLNLCLYISVCLCVCMYVCLCMCMYVTMLGEFKDSIDKHKVFMRVASKITISQQRSQSYN